MVSPCFHLKNMQVSAFFGAFASLRPRNQARDEDASLLAVDSAAEPTCYALGAWARQPLGYTLESWRETPAHSLSTWSSYMASQAK